MKSLKKIILVFLLSIVVVGCKNQTADNSKKQETTEKSVGKKEKENFKGNYIVDAECRQSIDFVCAFFM